MNTIVFHLYIRTLYGHISILSCQNLSIAPWRLRKKNKVFLSFHFFFCCASLISYSGLFKQFRVLFENIFLYLWALGNGQIFFFFSCLNSLCLFLLAIDWWLGFVEHVKVIFLINKVGNYFLFLFHTFCHIYFVNVID